ncbi:MAG TPA: KH domain-containing protein [Anaerolineae bacterium]|nr:KH domain-containing protein [Anaerolineae bacterium]
MRELVEYVAKSLVDNPDAVKVTQIRSPHATILKLYVAQDDKGVVIGRRGRVANAMRTLLRVASSVRRGQRVILEIV